MKQCIQYRYDSRGNRVGLTAPDGGRFIYSYDAVSRLKTVENPQAQRTTFLYDPAGRRTGTLLVNGTRTSTVYDAAGRHAGGARQQGSGCRAARMLCGQVAERREAPPSAPDSIGTPFKKPAVL